LFTHYQNTLFNPYAQFNIRDRKRKEEGRRKKEEGRRGIAVLVLFRGLLL
jgi:hypothetical protein